ncbi:hypothetical protein BB560_002276 [Smittium megazygosporum]|uniref:Ribosomal protein L17 n=1 Tax=Smittium megazygosporum TaxID=133381 RepID=A0A2T9ZF90_9FUNG|nr:hypothetical protein BB560_002276 [Smittium megazygosporum]
MPQLNMDWSHRKAVFRNLTTALIKNGYIETTLPKAKVLRKYAERIVTVGKRGDLNARKKAIEWLYEPKVTLPILFEDLAPRFMDRNGGYTRIHNLGVRNKDNAPMALIEYLNPAEPEKEFGYNMKIRRLAGMEMAGHVKVVFDNENSEIPRFEFLKQDCKPSEKFRFEKEVGKLVKSLEFAKVSKNTFLEHLSQERKRLEEEKEQNRDFKMENFFKEHFPNSENKMIYKRWPKTVMPTDD